MLTKMEDLHAIFSEQGFRWVWSTELDSVLHPPKKKKVESVNLLCARKETNTDVNIRGGGFIPVWLMRIINIARPRQNKSNTS